MKRFKSPEHAQRFSSYTLLWLLTSDPNDTFLLLRTIKRKDTVNWRHGGRSLPSDIGFE